MNVTSPCSLGFFVDVGEFWSQEGWSETVEYIRRIWTEEGPFDGMLGFSQGWGWICWSCLPGDIGGAIWSQGWCIFLLNEERFRTPESSKSLATFIFTQWYQVVASTEFPTSPFHLRWHFSERKVIRECRLPPGAILVAALVALGEMKAGKPLVSRAVKQLSRLLEDGERLRGWEDLNFRGEIWRTFGFLLHVRRSEIVKAES